MTKKENTVPGTINIERLKNLKNTTINLPASKSESNRVLILDALSGFNSKLHNLSEARDTVTMQKLLKSSDRELNVLDAGTTMRFLTAYFSVKNENKILTGTPRMCERPIKILVNALRTLGAEIDYLKNEGFPPIHIKSFNQKKNFITIRGDISSQYISALLMIAATLDEGLTLSLEGTIGSRPYIEMTLKLMKKFGIEASWTENKISVKKQPFKSIVHKVESDWSGASYWYSMVALADQAKLKLTNLYPDSLQGDIRIVEIMESLGVETRFDQDGAYISSKNSFKQPKDLKIDFKDCPDLAQTVAVACAAKGINCSMTGLESLRIKETDRILALQNELSKIGARLIESEREWKLIPNNDILQERIHINTYEDHRMAMAFAPLALCTDLSIEDPEVVNKSYPGFWRDLQKAGFATENSSKG